MVIRRQPPGPAQVSLKLRIFAIYTLECGLWSGLIIYVYISVSGSPNTSNTYLIPVPSLPEVLSLIII